MCIRKKKRMAKLMGKESNLNKAKHVKPDISKYKGFLFDLDGTLIDSHGIWNDADIDTIKHFRGKPRKNFIQEKSAFFHNNPNLANIYEEYFKYIIELYNLKNVKVTEFYELCYKIAHDKIRNIGYRQNADKLLNCLKQCDAKLSLITLSSNKTLDILMNENDTLKKSADIKEIFGNNIITSDMVKNKKPAPDAYICGIDKLSLSPLECFAFEDSYGGTLAAVRAKLDTCVIYEKHSDNDRDKIEKLTPYHIKNFDEITELIK